MELVKICSKCKESKTVDSFTSGNTKSGFHSWCKSCNNARTRNKRISDTQQGLCKNCSQGRLKGSSLCLFHFVKQNYKKSNALTELLINKLYAQKFECYYTGTLLLPGVNASLDHICPISKQGEDSPDNLVWVDFSVNRMKRNASTSYFFEKFYKQLEEMNALASLESADTKHQKLSYVLGIYYPSNMVIT